MVNQIVINLAENADRSYLLPHKATLENLISKKKVNFASAYQYLKAADNINQIIANYDLSKTDFKLINQLATLLADRYKSFSLSKGKSYFSSAITPLGYLSYCNHLFEDTKIVKISCFSQSVALEVLKQTKLKLLASGCGFDSLINTLSGILTQNILLDKIFITTEQSAAAESMFDLPLAFIPLADEILLRDNLYNKAYRQLEAAKSQHVEVEKLFIKAMDFDDINKKTTYVLDNIFN